MTSVQDAVVTAARCLIGVRFRPQGRDPAYGLDCVGVILMALARAGHPIDAERNYPQRGGDPGRISSQMASAGLRRIAGEDGEPGDILLMQAGPAQLHLALRTADGIVHADAGLRCVVETPGGPRWPVIGIWRIAEAG